MLIIYFVINLFHTFSFNEFHKIKKKNRTLDSKSIEIIYNTYEVNQKRKKTSV